MKMLIMQLFKFSIQKGNKSDPNLRITSVLYHFNDRTGRKHLVRVKCEENVHKCAIEGSFEKETEKLLKRSCEKRSCVYSEHLRGKSASLP